MEFKCGMPKFKDAVHGFVIVDAETTEVVNEGVYKVLVDRQQAQANPQSQQQEQVG
jgi:hypothetical protein